MIGQRQNEKGLWRYVRGQIVKFCDFANQYKDKQFVLILNELTRANTEAVLGQLFTAMENKYRRQEYYVLGIYGIGYQLRYSNKEYGRQALFYTNMSSFKGATTKELRQALYYRVYRTTLELTNKGINIAINVNRMILKLINLIKENSSNISLYACDNSNIAFAVPRSVEQQQLINRVKEIVLQLNLQDCFDYIVIGNSLSNPWRADRQDITVYEIDNKQER